MWANQGTQTMRRNILRPGRGGPWQQQPHGQRPHSSQPVMTAGLKGKQSHHVDSSDISSLQLLIHSSELNKNEEHLLGVFEICFKTSLGLTH